MICPVCGFENLQGDDQCQNCGAALTGVDVPQPAHGLEDRLVRDHLGRVKGRAPLLAAPDTPVRAAIRRMQDEAANCLLVGTEGHLEGIFTERDAVLKVAGRSMDGLVVADVMTRDPAVLRKDDTVAIAIHKMAVGGFRHMPLVEDGQVKGIVTAHDVFRHILKILG